MSTRSQIGFYAEKEDKLDDFYCMIYKHWDGYPEGNVPLIERYLGLKGSQNRRYDMEYLSAWMLKYLIDTVHDTPKVSEQSDYLGYGISHELHMDIEYYYAVYPDRVEVYRTKSMFPVGFDEMELLETLDI